MKNLIYLIFIISICLNNSNSQDYNISQYLPLNIGNSWVYYSYNPYPYGTNEKIKITIVDTVIHSTMKYFIYNSYVVHISGYGSCNAFTIFNGNPLRVDSVTGGVYQYADSGGCAYTPHEIMIDSFGAKVNDTVKIYCGNYNFYGPYRCGVIAEDSIFGVHATAKSYTSFYFEGGASRTFLEGFGMRENSMGAVNSWTFQYLMGCVIDGTLYGDTSMPVGIQNIYSNIPDNFKLQQNYPNPFNPVTKIKFSLPSPSKGGVKLIVLDILGREIAVLINEQLSPGTYEAEWDGSKYSSGVYFYKLITADYTETRKMVLVK